MAYPHVVEEFVAQIKTKAIATVGLKKSEGRTEKGGKRGLEAIGGDPSIPKK